MKTLKLLVLATVLAVSPACKKKDKNQPAAGSGSAPVATGSDTAGSNAMAGSNAAGSNAAGSNAMAGSDTAGSNAMAGSNAAGSNAAAAEDKSDWVKVYATHVAPNPADPVEVKFEKVKVVKAAFDPKKIEGGTATIEIDLASLKTSDPKRDEHLNTPDYLDTKKFATATVNVVNVKKKDDKTFTADAKVKLRNVEKTYPITFEVVEAGDDWIRIRGEHKFPRLDFKVGKEPNTETDMKKMDPKKDGVAADLTVKLQLTLKKT